MIFGLYGIVILIVMVKFGQIFLSLVDNLINQLAITLFFPSMAYYLITILITNGIAIYNLVKAPRKKYVKNLNMIIFSIINLLLFLTLSQVASADVNIYSTVSLYQSQEIVALVQLSMIIFTLWMISLGIIACVNKLAAEPVEVKEEVVVKEPVKEISYDFKPNLNTSVALDNESPIDYNSYLNTYPNRLFDNNEVMLTKAQDQMKEQVVEKVKEKEFLTLEDYRNLLSLLKDMRAEDEGSQKYRGYHVPDEELKLEELLLNSLNFGKSL